MTDVPYGRTTGTQRRVGARVLVIAAVALAHLVVTREIASRMTIVDANDMPKRIVVAYVRTIEPAPPPAAAFAPARTKPAPAVAAAARAPRRIAPAASQSAAKKPDVDAAESDSAALAQARAADDALAAMSQGARANEVAATSQSASPDARANEVAATSQSASTDARARDVVAPPQGTYPDPRANDVAAASQSASPADVAALTSGVAAASAAASSPGEAFAWPASTRVTYILTGNYRGEVSGQAQVEWIRLDDRYQVNLDLVVGPEFAPIISRRMTSEGSLASSGLVPERYDEDTQVVFRDRRRLSVVFEPEAVVLANGQRRERLAGVQDTASQFVQLTYLFSTQPEQLRVGNAFQFPLALPRTMDRWTYDVVAEQKLQTSFGPVTAYHLKPRKRERKNNELTAEIWVSPELRYLPVRIRIEQDTGANFLDLMIAKMPEIAAS